MAMSAIHMAQGILDLIRDWGYEPPGPEAPEILALICESIIEELQANAVVTWPVAPIPGLLTIYGFTNGGVNVGKMVTDIHNLLIGNGLVHDFFDQINGTRLMSQGVWDEMLVKTVQVPAHFPTAFQIDVVFPNTRTGIFATQTNIVSGITGTGMTARFESKIKSRGGTLDGVSLTGLDGFFTGINDELLNMSIRAENGGGVNVTLGSIQ